MLIRAIVLCSPLGLQNLNLKRKTKWILVVVVKWRHHENGLLRPQPQLLFFFSCPPIILLLCYSVTLLLGYVVTRSPRYSVTLLPRQYSVTLLLNLDADLSSLLACFSVTLLACYSVTLLLCYPVNLTVICYSVTLLTCYSVTLFKQTCQLSRCSLESPSFSSNLPGLPDRARNLPGNTYRGLFQNFLFNSLFSRYEKGKEEVD